MFRNILIKEICRYASAGWWKILLYKFRTQYADVHNMSTIIIPLSPSIPLSSVFSVSILWGWLWRGAELWSASPSHHRGGLVQDCWGGWAFIQEWAWQHSQSLYGTAWLHAHCSEFCRAIIVWLVSLPCHFLTSFYFLDLDRCAIGVPYSLLM